MPIIFHEQRAVLGVDAAWTTSGFSGVALAVLEGARWRVVHVAPGYRSFFHDAPGKVDWSAKHQGEKPGAKELLSRARELAGMEPCVVSLDMPITPRGRVNGRREADNAVSLEFGRFLCAVHSPTQERPGALGAGLCSEFEEEGYQVAVPGESRTNRELVEVYPHATLVRLTNAPKRLPYKVGKTKKYWPDLSLEDRARNLLIVFHEILTALRETMFIPPEIFGLPQEIRPPLAKLKTYEDGLDALVCVLAGIRFAEGKTDAYGDNTGVIWV